jgi:hypothetical protein
MGGGQSVITKAQRLTYMNGRELGRLPRGGDLQAEPVILPFPGSPGLIGVNHKRPTEHLLCALQTSVLLVLLRPPSNRTYYP